MAEVQDEDIVGGSEIEAEDAKQESEAAQAETKPEDLIPEEYRGKSVAEIVNMAQHARREMGRMGNELGEVRKLADELIKSQLHQKPNDEKPQEVDFFTNPQEAVNRLVANHPNVRSAEQYAKAVQMEQAKMRLAQLHPDHQQIVKDAEFAEWIKASPVRIKLYSQAENYDLDAAHELLSTYKTIKAVKQNKQAEVDTKARDATLKTAAVETGGSGEQTRKIYRRADLINLKLRDPRKFEAMQDEIDAAYREGRVR